jgi:thiosulfate/3-mercaptopyruvate sulfurtransferase
MYNTLISAQHLQRLLSGNTPVVVVDCSFDLANPAAGQAGFESEHIAGAIYAHLDTDLSAKTAEGQPVNAGRHPLPSREVLAARLGRMGISNNTQVVAYDRNGHMICGRLWWMLKWAGHEAVAVLDGGLAAWKAAGGAVATGSSPALPAQTFALAEPLVQLHHTKDVAAKLGQDKQTIVDARATPRFLGEVEPLDPVAGHIPGALNRPFASNFRADGCFKSPQALNEEVSALLGQRSASSVVHHCGSGVSAVPNIIAMEVAGLGRQPLYAGSWSEWCNTPGLPCAKG